MLIHAIRTDVSMEDYSVASKLSPSWSFIRRLFEAGRNEAEKWLQQNFRHIGKKQVLILQNTFKGLSQNQNLLFLRFFNLMQLTKIFIKQWFHDYQRFTSGTPSWIFNGTTSYELYPLI